MYIAPSSVKHNAVTNWTVRGNADVIPQHVTSQRPSADSSGGISIFFVTNVAASLCLYWDTVVAWERPFKLLVNGLSHFFFPSFLNSAQENLETLLLKILIFPRTLFASFLLGCPWA